MTFRGHYRNKWRTLRIGALIVVEKDIVSLGDLGIELLSQDIEVSCRSCDSFVVDDDFLTNMTGISPTIWTLGD